MSLLKLTFYFRNTNKQTGDTEMTGEMLLNLSLKWANRMFSSDGSPSVSSSPVETVIENYLDVEKTSFTHKNTENGSNTTIQHTLDTKEFGTCDLVVAELPEKETSFNLLGASSNNIVLENSDYRTKKTLKLNKTKPKDNYN